MMDTRSWGNEFHHTDEIEHCRLNFLYFGQSQETAHANINSRLVDVLGLSESSLEQIDNQALILDSYLRV